VGSPQHKVTIAKPFAVGRFPVTRGEYIAFVEETGRIVRDDAYTSFRNPVFAQDDSHPVVCVSWDDAKAYAKWLSGRTGKNYRLPSEAEWEYACRAATRTSFWWGSSISTQQANYDGTLILGGGRKGEYRERTVPVKSFEPNPWGLYQVHGNVWEWCEDCVNASYHGAPCDGSAWTAGDCTSRVLRGGCWHNIPALLRAANRGGDIVGDRCNAVGFRLARTFTI
jgi:formylglycine-generating enzyme required for sulfatase activity